MFLSQKFLSESRELVGEAGLLAPDILSEAHPGAPCPAAVAGLVPLGPEEVLGQLLVVVQRDVEAVQAHVLLSPSRVSLALDAEGGVQGGVLVVDVVQLVRLLGHVFRRSGAGLALRHADQGAGRATVDGELDKLLLVRDIRVSSYKGDHRVLVTIRGGGGGLAGELTDHRVGHLLGLIGGGGRGGEGGGGLEEGGGLIRDRGGGGLIGGRHGGGGVRLIGRGAGGGWGGLRPVAGGGGGLLGLRLGLGLDGLRGNGGSGDILGALEHRLGGLILGGNGGIIVFEEGVDWVIAGVDIDDGAVVSGGGDANVGHLGHGGLVMGDWRLCDCDWDVRLGITFGLWRPGDSRVNCHNFAGIDRVTDRFQIGDFNATL